MENSSSTKTLCCVPARLGTVTTRWQHRTAHAALKRTLTVARFKRKALKPLRSTPTTFPQLRGRGGQKKRGPLPLDLKFCVWHYYYCISQSCSCQREETKKQKNFYLHHMWWLYLWCSKEMQSLSSCSWHANWSTQSRCHVNGDGGGGGLFRKTQAQTSAWVGCWDF